MPKILSNNLNVIKDEVKESIVQQSSYFSKLDIDFSKVESVDLQGLVALNEIIKLLQYRKLDYKFWHASDEIKEVLDIVGLM
ncbi:STAS domain-containing protein [Lysinibacillus sp. NPDC098008]|uniref:STAS domain-containing protein n=1 Tax=Lysinibacillus sp. NPDC098008 TaxID=3364146 RepID=UPI0038286E03